MMFDAKVVVACPFCRNVTTIEVVEKDYLAWRYNGVLIQNAMPYLSANKRETLISGLCDKCQSEEVFPSSEEDDDMDDEPDDIDDDCGFDPFEGCFTYDC